MTPDLSSLHKNLETAILAYPDLNPSEILAQASPSVRVRASRANPKEIGLGQSRIGGTPDVPAGFEWPRWLPTEPCTDRYTDVFDPQSPVPLGFIAQIDLRDVPRVNDLLPKSGWLYFFYDRYVEPWGFDPAESGGWRVIHLDCNPDLLQRTAAPADAAPEHQARFCKVIFEPELTLTEYPEYEFQSPKGQAFHQFHNSYFNSGETHHRLGGFPQTIQGPMELRCQLAANGIYCGDAKGYQSKEAKALEPGAADWRLLLQIDTDEEGPGWLWGDVGRIYYWIKEADLQAKQFDRTWLILQCY